MLVKDLYYEKYLKYKNKYLNLQSQIGGGELVYQLNWNSKEIDTASHYFTMAYNKYVDLSNSTFWSDNRPVEEVNDNKILVYSPDFSSISNLTKVNFQIFIDALQKFNFSIEKNNDITKEESFVILTDITTGNIYILSNDKNKLIEWTKYVNSDKFNL